MAIQEGSPCHGQGHYRAPVTPVGPQLAAVSLGARWGAVAGLARLALRRVKTGRFAPRCARKPGCILQADVEWPQIPGFLREHDERASFTSAGLENIPRKRAL
ncbi:hypothetical protein DKK66_10100 [Aquitalea sp. USM4]|nr:hypothetical protein DKK66_10100 [Aquitalea sp. USM4]